MKEYKVNSEIDLTIPALADHIVIIHEWGDLELSYVSVSPGSFSFTPSSVGVMNVYYVKNLIVSSNVVTQQSDPVQKPRSIVTGSNLTTYFTGLAGITGTTQATIVSKEIFTVVAPLVSSHEFFNDFNQLDDDTAEDDFSYVERLVRLFLQRYTQQTFGPYINKTLNLQGQGGFDLPLEYPIRTLRNIIDSYGNDLSDLVQVSDVSPYFIHHQPTSFWLDNSVDIGYIDRKRDTSYRGSKQFFSTRLYFMITGDFGYYWVPQDVTEAAKLLIADTFTGAQDLRRAGIKQAQLGDYSYVLEKSGDGTTGNFFADQLLANYIQINLALA